MSQVFVTQLTCPSCQNQFPAPVDRVLDVSEDPSVKMRVLNGLVNVVKCPHCGVQGALNIPFLYFDSENELALIYMPMDAGRDEMERQKEIGDLTNVVMESLPPEERKAYLLQPQVFLTMENLINKILGAEGITPEMIEEQKVKAALLQRMMDASPDQALRAIIKENDAMIDAAIFQLLDMNLELAQASGQADDLQRLLHVRSKLLQWSTQGQRIQARREMLDTLRAEPTREKLLELLIQADDEETLPFLVAFGMPLLDYKFFQSFTARVDSVSDAEEKERLAALRSEILQIRQQIERETRALYEERSKLLQDLLLSKDPEALARRRFSELDQAFFNLLSANLEEVRSQGDPKAVQALQGIWALALSLMEETLPPEMRLFNRLMEAENDQAVEELLENNRDLLTDRLIQFMEQAVEEMREEGSEEKTEHLASVLAKVKEIIGN